MMMRAAVVGAPHVGTEKHDALHTEVDGEIDRALQARALTDSAGTIEAEPGRRHLAPQSKKAWACAPNRYGDDAPGKGSEGRTPAMGIPPTCIAKEKEISEWRSLVTGIDHDYPPAARSERPDRACWCRRQVKAVSPAHSGATCQSMMPDRQTPIEMRSFTGGGNVDPPMGVRSRARIEVQSRAPMSVRKTALMDVPIRLG